MWFIKVISLATVLFCAPAQAEENFTSNTLPATTIAAWLTRVAVGPHVNGLYSASSFATSPVRLQTPFVLQETMFSKMVVKFGERTGQAVTRNFKARAAVSIEEVSFSIRCSVAMVPMNNPYIWLQTGANWQLKVSGCYPVPDDSIDVSQIPAAARELIKKIGVKLLPPTEIIQTGDPKLD